MIKIVALLFLLFSAGVAIAENSVTFETMGNPGFLNIEGKGAKVDFGRTWFEGGKFTGIFEVKLDNFDTGLSLRNKHLREKYLETEKYPMAKLWLKPVSIPKHGFFNWEGKLTLHGTKKKVEGTAFIGDGKVEAKFNILMSEFNIQKASYAGVGVDDKVSIIVKLDAIPGLVLP
jgi:polyisoprenoid-binding protein YceI